MFSADTSLATKLSSSSQRTRVITESWFANFAYCLRCSSDCLERTAANTPARDFVCLACSAPYELKSSARPIGKKIIDGAFSTMMHRIENDEAPNLIVLRYTSDWQIGSVIALNSVFLTPEVIEKRRPLSPHAKRHGWVGCNILLDRIPVDGQISLAHDGAAVDKAVARKLYAQSERLRTVKPDQRGWTALILDAVRRTKKKVFVLADIYSQEEQLRAAYPTNTHVRPKIRQQLQILRDLGYIEFLSRRGEYRVLL